MSPCCLSLMHLPHNPWMRAAIVPLETDAEKEVSNNTTFTLFWLGPTYSEMQYACRGILSTYTLYICVNEGESLPALARGLKRFLELEQPTHLRILHTRAHVKSIRTGGQKSCHDVVLSISSHLLTLLLFFSFSPRFNQTQSEVPCNGQPPRSQTDEIQGSSVTTVGLSRQYLVRLLTYFHEHHRAGERAGGHFHRPN